ncbi:MAG: DUF6065 family protein [Flavobacteriaceae bacterium]
MKLDVYLEDGMSLDIRPARADREWLDAFVEKFAYGCLPMLIANQHGWEILSPVGFTAVWNGGEHRDCLAVLEDEPVNAVVSHFGGGIFSYRLPAVFVTEPGYDLVFQGPPNFPVDGATPLTGMVETDWLRTSVAMHWKMTRPGTAVRFRKGDPICHIFPVKRGEIEAVEPRLSLLSADSEMDSYMKEWGRVRGMFNDALQQPDSPERRRKWPGNYRRGEDVAGRRASPDDHRTKLRVRPFSILEDDTE